MTVGLGKDRVAAEVEVGGTEQGEPIGVACVHRPLHQELGTLHRGGGSVLLIGCEHIA